MTRPLVYLVEVPAPYRNAEVDRAVQGLGPGSLVTLFARASADGAFEYRLPTTCPFHVIDGSSAEQGVPLGQIETLLDHLHPSHVIVGGYHQAVYRRTLAWCRARRVPYSLRSDSNVWADREKGWLRYVVRRARLARHVHRAHSVLLTGTCNRAFWQRYGLRASQEAWWPQWIDYDHFATARTLRQNQRGELRAKFGALAEPTLLYVGRLVPRKRVDLLCEALLRSGAPAGLLIAGSGPSEAPLRARYQAALGTRVRWLGAIQPADLPALYAAADALVLPSGSTEPWGMVLVEAACAGLPLVCDHRVGAAADLLVSQRNGWALPANELTDWIDALRMLSNQTGQLASMGQASQQIADAWRERSDPVVCLRSLTQPRATT